MFNPKNLIVLAVCAAALVIPRDAATIESDLDTINSAVQSLTSAANNYDGGLIGAVPVEDAENKLASDIKTATTDAEDSSELTDAQAVTIVDYINDTLQPSVAAAITAIEKKKSEIAAAGLTSTVQSALSTLKSDTDSFGTALIAKTPSGETTAAQDALNKIDSDFAAAITFFS